MGDYLVRATAADHAIRAFACTTKELVEYARSVHDTSPVATACLGRLLSAGAIMGSQMKGEEDVMTLSITGDGPIGGIVVTANNHGQVKGYVNYPQVDLPPNEKGKLDVSGAIGAGTLRVIQDIGLKDPYVGSIDLVSGEIAEDITYYYAKSEQIPSAVALGVLCGQEGVRQAGGLMVQLMPFASEEVICALEKKFGEMNSLTALLNQNMSPEDILDYVLGDLGLEIMDKMDLSFTCNCSRERVEKAILSCGAKEIESMIEEGKPIEVNCHFCNHNYEFTVDDLKDLLANGK